MHNTPETRDQPHRASIRETPLAICVPNSVSPLSVFFFFPACAHHFLGTVLGAESAPRGRFPRPYESQTAGAVPGYLGAGWTPSPKDCV